MYSKKILFIALFMELIVQGAYVYMEPLVDNPFKKTMFFAAALIPILVLLAIIGADKKIDSQKRILSIGVFVFLIILFIVITFAEFNKDLFVL